MNIGQKTKNKQYQKQKSSHITQQQQGLSNKEIQQRVKRISTRLNRENICREHKLISNMNLKLQTTLGQLMKMDQFKNASVQDAMKILQRVSYLEPVQQSIESHELSSTISTTTNSNSNSTYIQPISNCKNTKHSLSSQKQHYHEKYEHKINLTNNCNPLQLLYKLKYHHSQKTIILAGINRLWTENAIKEFNATSLETVNHRSSSYKKHPTNNYQHLICQISGVNEFWIAVEADTPQNAQFFKKFIRLRKKSFEAIKDFSFKQDKRRVRIVMQNQDFYTLLVDAMTQKKNSQFIKRLVNPNSGMFPTMCLRDTRRTPAFDNEEYQLSLKKANKILYFPIIVHRPQIKEGDDHFTLDEVYSEDRSRASQLFQSSSNMDDLVQKADQGTQAQSLGVGTHDDSVGTQDLELNRLDSNESEITSEMVSMNNRNRVHEEKSWQSLNEFESVGEDGVDDGDIDKKNETQQSMQNPVQIAQKKQQNVKRQCQDLEINPLKKNMNAEESQPESDHDAFVVDLTKINTIKRQLKQKTNDNYDNFVNLHQNIDIPLQKTSLNPNLSTPPSLLDVRQPQIPGKLLTFYFSTHSQTQNTSLNYTKMKRLEQQYIKKSASRIKLTPGIPQDFRQVSEQQRNRDLFFFNIFKSMEKRSQKKQWISEFF